MKEINSIEWKICSTVDTVFWRDFLMISNPLLKKRFKIKTDSFIEYLISTHQEGTEQVGHIQAYLQEKGFLDPSVDEYDTSQIKHWIDRGWYDSLIYLMWSKTPNFIDDNDNDGRLRRNLIESYIKDEGPPKRVLTNDSKVRLSLPNPKIAEQSNHVQSGIKSALFNRRTQRIFSGDSITQEIFSYVIWNGLKRVRSIRKLTYEDPLDYFGSHGTEFDFVLVIYGIEGITKGIYLYDLLQNSLSLVKEGDFREVLVKGLWDHKAPMSATHTILFVSDFGQYQWRYRHERALRNIFIEAGRIAQRLIIEGERFGVGSLPTPATRDTLLENLLGLDRSKQFVVYTLTMGKKVTLKSNMSKGKNELEWVREI